jgi:D-glycero-D-manno-heptose 1,7-bisphosphate phosphatase
MPKTIVLLDRDGTIVNDPGYLADPEALVLLDGVAAGLRRLREVGCGLVVVTNQSGIGRGLFDEATLARIHDRLRELLAAEGAPLEAIYFCPHVEEDGCRCRKPQPGMAEQAAREHGFDLRAAYVIGDREADVGLARAIGATSILVRTGMGRKTEDRGECRPDHVADDLRSAAQWIATRQ